MSDSGHDMHLLTGSYALDALTDEERAEFERHLARCRSCTDEVRGLRETAARLAMAAAAAPPPEMRARVLAAVPRTRQLPPIGAAPRARHALGKRVPFSRAGLSATILTLAAAIVVLLVLQVSTVKQLHQVQASGRAVAAVLAAPDARAQSLPAAGGGTVNAVTSLNQQEAVVTAAHLPALSGGRVYQLWVMNGTETTARSAGLLTLSGTGSAQPALAAGVASGEKLGITVEPAGGTERPTTTPVVVMPVTAE